MNQELRGKFAIYEAATSEFGTKATSFDVRCLVVLGGKARDAHIV